MSCAGLTLCLTRASIEKNTTQINEIVIPDDYQDIVDQLECFSLIRHYDVTRYRVPARDLNELIERLGDADVVVSIRERIEFSRGLLEKLPNLKLIALVGRSSKMIDFAACTQLGIPVATGKSNSPVAPAERPLALILTSRRNVALEADRMKRGEWPCTLSHRLRGLTLGIFGLGAIGQLVAEGGRGLGMDILVWGQQASLEKAAAAGYARAANKEALLERSDVLSLHVRFNADTRGIVGPNDLDRMKATALNCCAHCPGRAHRAGSIAGSPPQGPPGLCRGGRLRAGAHYQRRSSVLVHGERPLHAASRLAGMDEF